MSSPIETIQADLITGQIAMYLAGNGNANTNALKGGSFDNRLPKMLYMEETIIQNIYNLNPSDPNLRQTTNYLYSLYGIWGVLAEQRQGQLAQNPPTITNPNSITVYVGGTATFQVSVSSTLSYTVQWYRNGVPIAGATSTTYQLLNAQLTDTGATFSATATNVAGSASSTSATLTVTNPLTGYYWYGSSDPYPALSSGSDTLAYQGTFNIIAGQPLVVTWPTAAANNYFEVVKYPSSESIKTTWSFGPLNNGTIPDAVQRAIITLNGYNYLISRVTMSFQTSLNIETIS
jgi:hypothetical protein